MDDDLRWDLVSAERRDVLALLQDLQMREWDTLSLCAGWRVRDVVGHLTMATDTPLSSAVMGLVRAGFDVDRFLARTAVQRGSAPLTTLLSGWRRAVDSRRTPPGGTAGQMLVEVVSHAQDIRRPLGRQRPTPPERLRTALDTAVRLGGPFGSRQRAAGLHLVAPELDWTAGDPGDPEVRGPGDALLLALLGRAGTLDELDGPGLDRWR
ncbi:maleylpyruvate isomerase family mycothiol-dependent enzyme [Modestobacter lapidis]|nr:maleylpyruvate isomerase family mycothiol-dependent enzyme [Modestobacter lapidis]